MAYHSGHPGEPLPQHQGYENHDEMAQRHTSWAPSPAYGPPRHSGEAYHYEAQSPRLPPPSGLLNAGSQPRPMSQDQQYRPDYYQQPPSPSYHQPPPQYQHYQPPPHPSMVHDPYRPPMARYPTQESPQAAPPVANEPYDEFREAREQHMMMRNQAPAPRVQNTNYDGKVAIPFTPPGLRIPAVRSGSAVPAGGPWSATSQPDRAVKIEDLCHVGPSSVKNEFAPDQKFAPEQKFVPDQKFMPDQPAPPPNEYEIFFRQQPVAARCCGYGERDRRVIDPPPIVQLRINNPNLTPDEMYDRIHFPSYVVHCSIWDKEGNKDETDMPAEYVRPGKRIMGSLVSSPFVGNDETGQEGCFFCFPDMSVRTPGFFRLRFSLIVVHPTHRSRTAPIKSTIMSDVFQVYNAKDFPGMQASTELTKRLKEQGCLISIKKGNEKSGGKSRRQDDSDEDDEEGGSSSKRRKSKKQR